MSKGKLICIEGVDSVGKETQTKALAAHLEKQGYKVLTLTFPDYDTLTGQMTREMLTGKFGDPTALHPDLAGLFYALDRVKYKARIDEALDAGTIVIADRYTYSNAGFQGAKLKGEEQLDYFLRCEKLEFDELGLPRPDLVLFLDARPSVAMRLMEQRKTNGKVQVKDGHESNKGFLDDAYDSYLELGRIVEQWKAIQCVENDDLRSIEVISEEIRKVVKNSFDIG